MVIDENTVGIWFMNLTATSDHTTYDEVLKARAESGPTQAEVGARVGTTQSAIARLESAAPKHSPSIATLR